MKTMRDQAAELRRLVLRSARERAVESGPVPWLIVLTGGKGGVGATTIAVNLSVALSESGLRVVIVDADLYRADVAALCGLPERSNVSDVLSARRDIHEVLERGPAGIQIVPGIWAPGTLPDCGEKAQLRLIGQLRTLGRHADVIVLDAGGGPSDVLQRFWHEADKVLLVTTADSVSVMDTYATMKMLVDRPQTAPLHIVVNRADSAETARDVEQRIDQSCRRFLGFSVAALGHVPDDPQVSQAAREAVPYVLRYPDAPASRAVEQVAAALANQLAQRRPSDSAIA